jgi:hypothetical protein
MPHERAARLEEAGNGQAYTLGTVRRHLSLDSAARLLHDRRRTSGVHIP